ncbi:MAG: hypothetical protein DYH07_11215 [Armatimonadetes bacterium ATM1]|nr:hypothetical protein [Armatimonadetes bacterium ATM1]
MTKALTSAFAASTHRDQKPAFFSWDCSAVYRGRTLASSGASIRMAAIGQLLSETKAGYAASYTYDANGNRLTKTLNGVRSRIGEQWSGDFAHLRLRGSGDEHHLPGWGREHFRV